MSFVVCYGISVSRDQIIPNHRDLVQTIFKTNSDNTMASIATSRSGGRHRFNAGRLIHFDSATLSNRAR